MLLQRTDHLPSDGSRWAYELKLDGYRAIAANTGEGVRLWSRNGNDFTTRYETIARGLAKLPARTVIDGEVVALDAEGRPSFNALQNADAKAQLVYFVFDVLVLRGRDVMREPFEKRRALLERQVLPTLTDPVRYTGELNANLRELIASVKAQGLEGLVAKRRDSRYEAGERSGAWQKMRVNRGQELVIGGYTVGTKAFDAVILGYYDEPYRVCRRAHSERGWSPWHDPASTPRSCVNARSDSSSITPTSIPRSGPLFDPSPRRLAARSKRCAGGCARRNGTPGNVLASRPTNGHG
jgi:ATP-dependent DNA ligase